MTCLVVGRHNSECGRDEVTNFSMLGTFFEYTLTNRVSKLILMPVYTLGQGMPGISFKNCWVGICFPGSDVYVCTYVKNLICISFFFQKRLWHQFSVSAIFLCKKKCWFILSVPDWVWLKRTINKSKSIGSYH